MTQPTHLERRLKRHLGAPLHQCFAITLPDFEPVCGEELAALGGTIAVRETVRGGVLFTARLIDLLRANLHLRTAVRILLRLADFRASNFHHLEKQCAAMAWDLYLPAGAVPSISFSARRSRLYHGDAVRQRVEQTLAAFWRARGMAPTATPDQTLYLRLDQDRLTLSLDSSGAPLYRRGLKSHDARAPLRETTAATILKVCGFRMDRPLLDPMCGAGTFSLEAALMLKQTAPGRLRRFAFMQWPGFRPRQWEYLLAQADGQVSACPSPMVFALDRDPGACTLVRTAAARHGLQDALQVACADFFDLRIRDLSPGLVVLNPPYGRRLDVTGGRRPFYERLGRKLAGEFKGWRAALIVPDASLAALMPAGLKDRPLDHGGLQLRLLCGTIP